MIEPKDMRLEDMFQSEAVLQDRNMMPEILGPDGKPSVWYKVEWAGSSVSCRCCGSDAGGLFFDVPLSDAFFLADSVRTTCGLAPQSNTLLEKASAVLFFYYINRTIKDLLK